MNPANALTHNRKRDSDTDRYWSCHCDDPQYPTLAPLHETSSQPGQQARADLGREPVHTWAKTSREQLFGRAPGDRETIRRTANGSRKSLAGCIKAPERNRFEMDNVSYSYLSPSDLCCQLRCSLTVVRLDEPMVATARFWPKAATLRYGR